MSAKSKVVGVVSDYPAVVSSIVAGAILAALAKWFGAVPDTVADSVTNSVNDIVGWILPIVVTLVGGLFTQRRVTPVARAERGLRAGPSDPGSDAIEEIDASDTGDSGFTDAGVPS